MLINSIILEESISMKFEPSTQIIVAASSRPPLGTVGSLPLEWVKKFRKKPLRRPPPRKRQK
jgi:hypothetical protein